MRIESNNAQVETFEHAVRTLADYIIAEYRRSHTVKEAIGDKPCQTAGGNNNEPKLLGVEGLAKYLSIPKGSIYSMVCMRKIPERAVVRLGRSLRFDVKVIDQWVEEGRSKK